jgi:multidrug efflux pump subunit AcrA (membrane-fusion protein)
MTVPWKKILVPLAILGGALLIALLLIRTKPPVPAVEVREKAWLVSAERVEPGAWAPSLTLYGRIESLWSSQLAAGTAAEVLEVHVLEGDPVAAGQLLVSLDPREAQLVLAQRDAELREAEARIASEQTRHANDLRALPRERELLRLTEGEVARLSDLVKKQVGAQSQLDTARQAVARQAIAVSARAQAVEEHDARLAELEARRVRAEALRDQARLELERCRVTAPFQGRIAQVTVAPGRRVRVGDPLLEVYDTAALVVRAQLPNRHLPVVRRALTSGSELWVQGEIDGQPVRARLLQLTGQVAAATGGVEALFELEDGGELLQQGRFVRLDLQLPEQQGLVALPHEAIYSGDRVYRIDADSRMRPVPVTRVGEARTADGRSRVLVRSAALGSGDLVVATQLPNAIDGLLVRLPQPAS